MHDLVGKSYVFEDGNSIKIIQVKVRDNNELWFTCMIQQGPGIPKKLILKQSEFVESFGHLFNFKTEDIPQEPN